MKKLGLGLGILIVVVIGAILIVPSFLNWNEYKVEIEETASEYTGRTVVIKGDISMSLLPMTALSVKDVSVTNLDGGRAEYMLSLKSLDVKVSFPSVISLLFGGKVKVEKFILVDPVVALEVLPDGRVNWDLGGDASEGSEQASSADISLDKFQIVNGQVSFEDMASQQMELLRKINANVKVKSINGPIDVTGSAKYKGLDAELSFSLGKIRPGKKVPVNITMSMLDGQVKVGVLGGVILSGKDSSFSGKLDMKANDGGDMFNIIDRIKGLKPPSDIRIGQNFSFDTAVVVAADNIAVKDLNIRMGQSRGQGAIDVSLGEKINIQANLSINKLDMNPLLVAFADQQNQTSPETVKQADVDGEQVVVSDLLKRLAGSLDLRLGALKYNGKIASQIAVKLTAKDGIVDISTVQARMPGGSGLNFKGQIGSQEDNTPILTGDLSVNASNLRGLLSWLKVDVSEIPSGQLTQFSYKSGLKVTSELVQFYTVAGKLDAMSFKGGVSYALEGRSSYGISLDMKNLNLDAYMSNRKPEKKSDLKKALGLLDEFDVSYDIALSNITLSGMKIRSGKLDGLLLGGKLDAKVIRLEDMAGINFTGSAVAKNFSSNPELTLKLSADAKSLVTLQRVLKLDDKFDLRRLGQMKIDGSLTTTYEKMDLDIKSSLGVSKFDVKGVVRSATLKQFPEIGSADLAVNGRSTSLTALIDQFDLPIVRPRASDDRPVALKGRIKSSSDFIDVDGKINIAAGEVIVKSRSRGKGKAASLDMTMDLKGSDTREFIRGLGIDFQPSKRELGPIALKMKVVGSGDQYSFSNIVGDVGPVKLSGDGKVNMASAKPDFDFNLKAGDIPLHSFLKAADKSGKNNKARGQWTRSTMDLSLLSDYDGRVQVSAASLRYNDYIFENPAFGMVLKDEIITVDDFTGRLFGGVVGMSGSFGGTAKPKMALAMTLKKASLSQATKSSAGIEPVTGFFDLSCKFSGEGKSQYDIISSLSGNGEIVANPGLINGIDIPALSNQLSDMSSNGAFGNLLGTTLSGGQTSYNGGISTITAKDGQLVFSPFDIELDGAKSNVAMAVDLVKWDIRSNGSLSLYDHPDAPPIGVAVTGDVSRPNVVYNTDRLKKYVGAKIASNMLQKLVGGEGGLEGIFGEKPKEVQPTAPPPAEDNSPQSPPQGESKPVEEYGQKLLQKLFEKKPAKKDEPNP
ncbi:MAG: AsmA family protein [Emcibacter sp.]|nr:AsmA family protein [Emcibacter sp.]